MEISFTLNDRSVTVNVDPSMLLVDLLREKLSLTGTHVGCDTSQCGACRGHLDGQSGQSCTLLAVSVDGAEVLTVEGLSSNPAKLHPMQHAFRENHGLQCGFCTPGMVMAATSLITEGRVVDEQSVRIGLEGNLCRCTGYHNIVAAVLDAAGLSSKASA